MNSPIDISKRNISIRMSRGLDDAQDMVPEVLRDSGGTAGAT